MDLLLTMKQNTLLIISNHNSIYFEVIWTEYMITEIQLVLKADKILYNFLLARRPLHRCTWDIRLLETSSKTYVWQVNGSSDSATAFLTPVVGSLNYNHLVPTFKAPIPSFSSTGLQLDSELRSAKARLGTVNPPPANSNSLPKRGHKLKIRKIKNPKVFSWIVQWSMV